MGVISHVLHLSGGLCLIGFAWRRVIYDGKHPVLFSIITRTLAGMSWQIKLIIHEYWKDFMCTTNGQLLLLATVYSLLLFPFCVFVCLTKIALI